MKPDFDDATPDDAEPQRLKKLPETEEELLAWLEEEFRTDEPTESDYRKANAQLRQAMFDMVDFFFASIWIGGKLIIMWIGWDKEDNGIPRLSSKEDVRAHLRQHSSFLRNIPRRTWVKTNPFDIWLDNSKRTQYERLVFKPGVQDSGDDYNLFRGLPCKPYPGDCSCILEHLRSVICAGDAELYDYVIQWLANLVQSPQDKPGTVLALSSDEGAGKGTLFRYLRKLFGVYALQLAGSDLLLGRFNDFLIGKLLVMADEAAWPGDKRGIEKFRSYITEEKIPIERKGIPAFEMDNYARFIIATNREHSAPASITDRRWVVLPVSNERRDDAEYWNALTAEMDSDLGPRAFLHHLLKEVKVTRNLRENPKTEALADQKLLSLDHIGEFWRAVLVEGKLDYRKPDGETSTLHFGHGAPILLMHSAFLDFAARRRWSHPESVDALGRGLRRYLPSLGVREARKAEKDEHGLVGREKVYTLPELVEARKQFEAALGHEVSWPEEGF